ncbi:Ff.00g063250.m01.CDS01 [Fusarium sp. VM40]|nr:Ff.00g063250.m01.CDS01 [Fusarium sp. VM40]
MNDTTAITLPGYTPGFCPEHIGVPPPAFQTDVIHPPILNQVPGLYSSKEGLDGFFIPPNAVFDMEPGLRRYDCVPGPSGNPPSVTLPTDETERVGSWQPDARGQLQQIMQISGQSSSSGVDPSRPRNQKPKRMPKTDQFEKPKRQRNAKNNTTAAAKYRCRRRDEASALTSQEQSLEQQNRYLSACIEALTVEINYLKTQLLQHTSCSCVLIQTYIASEAKRIVESGLPDSSAFQANLGSTSRSRPSQSETVDSPQESLGILIPGSEAKSLAWPQSIQQDFASSMMGGGMADMITEPYSKGLVYMHNQYLVNMALPCQTGS